MSARFNVTRAVGTARASGTAGGEAVINRNRAYSWAAVAVATAVLAGALALIAVESRWNPASELLEPQAAFLHGSIGTELIPLPVLQVLPQLFPDKFPPVTQTGGWIRKYGFIAADGAQLLDSQKGASAAWPEHGLPLGFTAAARRPISSFASPVPFVGFSCATCHSTEVRQSDDEAGIVVLGPGNTSLHLLGFFEELRAAIVQTRERVDEEPEFVLTIEAVAEQHEKLGRPLGVAERLFIRAWITQARALVVESFASGGEPQVGEELFNPRLNRAGPLRSNPFANLMRNLLDRPGLSADTHDFAHGYVKFATVFEQGAKEWGQFDGTVRKLDSRSAFAAVAAGASLDSLTVPEVMHNVSASSRYVEALTAPQWEELFPAQPIDRERARRGQVTYRQQCSACHGYRDMDTRRWAAEADSRLGEVVGLDEIGTDAERLRFAHQERLPDRFRSFFGDLPRGLLEGFPNGHPFAVAYDPTAPAKNDVRVAAGYLNAPLHGAFLRAPYLHNASVLTLRELINLDRRRDTFYRGANLYDVGAVGLASPTRADSKRPWRFVSSLRGNSNRGHDYPGSFAEGRTPEETARLEDLLEYLKTL